MNKMSRLGLPMSTIHHICEFRYATAQSTDDDFTAHYEFKWCLRSPCWCRLLMQSGTQYHNDVLKTRCVSAAEISRLLQCESMLQQSEAFCVYHTGDSCPRRPMMTTLAMQAFTLACMLPFTRGSIPGVNDNMRASVYACFGKAAIVRPRAPPPGRQASHSWDELGWGPLLQLQQPPPEGMDPRAGATPPRGGTKKKSHLCATRHSEGNSSKKLHIIAPPPSTSPGFLL